MTAIKNYKHVGFVHSVHAGVVKTVLPRPAVERSAVLPRLALWRVEVVVEDVF